jgi:hypothetical protein
MDSAGAACARIVSEVTLSVILLASADLPARCFFVERTVDLGFELRISLPPTSLARKQYKPPS